MAYSKTMLSSLVLILFLITTPQTSHGLIIDGINILQIRVAGILYCTSTANPDPSCGGTLCPRAIGSLVTISCNGGRTTLGEVFTNTTGAFEVVLNVLDGLLFDQSQCAVYVHLPLATCAVSPPTGVLRGAVKLLDVVPIALGGIARFITLPFQVVSGL